MSIGQLIEHLYCNGIAPGRALAQQERADIVEFALPFEECSCERAELEAMADKDLIQAAYWVMAEYARGQI